MNVPKNDKNNPAFVNRFHSDQQMLPRTQTHLHNYEHTLPESRKWREGFIYVQCSSSEMLLFHDSYLVCMNLSHSFSFIFMFVSLPLEWLIKVCAVLLFSNSSASLLYLFTFRWGSHTSVCWERILISCNFPVLTCMRVKCGSMRQEDTDVVSLGWQMKNECEIDTWVCCITHYIFPHQMSSVLHICKKDQSVKASSAFHFVPGIRVLFENTVDSG